MIEVPRGTAHQFWNPGEEEAAVRWITLSAGRTLEFFRELAGAGSGSREGDPATLLERYAETPFASPAHDVEAVIGGGERGP